MFYILRETSIYKSSLILQNQENVPFVLQFAASELQNKPKRFFRGTASYYLSPKRTDRPLHSCCFAISAGSRKIRDDS